MIRNTTLQSVLLALLCVALLVGRINGAHLHLCFDGQEKAASLHLFEVVDGHAGHSVESAHQDADLSVAGSAIAKAKYKLDLTPFLLVAIVLLGVTFIRTSLPRITSAPRVAALSPWSLLPPLRGPPSISL